MSDSESKPNTEAIVYFVIFPLEGPAYRICGDDELQALGGAHALERHLKNQSYWFARMGQISTDFAYRLLLKPHRGPRILFC